VADALEAVVTAQGTATPTGRQVALATRGVIVPGVDLVMSLLQQIHPRREFRPGDGEPVAATPWRRGGTSPGGSSLSGPVGGGGEAPGQVVTDNTGTYFVGWADERTAAVPPQRIVWTPPEPGQERYGPPQSVGWLLDQDPDGQEILRPMTAADVAGDAQGVQAGYGYGAVGYAGQTGVGHPAGAQGTAPATMHGEAVAGAGGGYDRMAGGGPWASLFPRQGDVPGGRARRAASPHVYSEARTWVVPMTAHVWGHDWDDTELLARCLVSAAETVWQGTLAHMGEPVTAGSGWVRDEKGSRGLHWTATFNFATPIVFPPMLEGRLLSFTADVARVRNR
jgi:hypothetical protein